MYFYLDPLYSNKCYFVAGPGLPGPVLFKLDLIAIIAM